MNRQTVKAIERIRAFFLCSESEHDIISFPGHKNVRVKLGVVPAAGGDVIWMDLHCGRGGLKHSDEEYFGRCTWLPDKTLAVQVENRHQTKLQLLKIDPATGKTIALYLMVVLLRTLLIFQHFLLNGGQSHSVQ
jgi:hypothetical protein